MSETIKWFKVYASVEVKDKDGRVVAEKAPYRCKYNVPVPAKGTTLEAFKASLRPTQVEKLFLIGLKYAALFEQQRTQAAVRKAVLGEHKGPTDDDYRAAFAAQPVEAQLAFLQAHPGLPLAALKAEYGVQARAQREQANSDFAPEVDLGTVQDVSTKRRAAVKEFLQAYMPDDASVGDPSDDATDDTAAE